MLSASQKDSCCSHMTVIPVYICIVFDVLIYTLSILLCRSHFVCTYLEYNDSVKNVSFVNNRRNLSESEARRSLYYEMKNALLCFITPGLQNCAILPHTYK
jgi:hypothetical protein